MVQPESTVLLSKPFSCTVQLPSWPNTELLACGAEWGRPHFHLISGSKGLAFGKLELVACYVKSNVPGEYQLTTVSRNYAIELEMPETAGPVGAYDGGGIWVEFRGEPLCEVHEVLPFAAVKTGIQPKNTLPASGKRLEVEVRGVVEVRTNSVVKAAFRGEAAREKQGSEPPALPSLERLEEDLGLSIGPWRNSSSTANSLRSRVTALHPEPKLRTGEEPDNLPSKPPFLQEQTRPIPSFPRGAETIPPYVWRMPGPG